MKALVYRGPRDIRYEDVTNATLQASDHALVRIKQCAICGSDLHLYHGEYSMQETNLVVGHEFIGEVLEVGRDVLRFTTGDIVLSSAA